MAVQGGGGPFAIFSYDKPGRYERGSPLVNGHTGAVLDLDFNPFHEQARLILYANSVVLASFTVLFNDR